jgi:hypothetical protein
MPYGLTVSQLNFLSERMSVLADKMFGINISTEEFGSLFYEVTKEEVYRIAKNDLLENKNAKP